MRTHRSSSTLTLRIIVSVCFLLEMFPVESRSIPLLDTIAAIRIRGRNVYGYAFSAQKAIQVKEMSRRVLETHISRRRDK